MQPLFPYADTVLNTAIEAGAVIMEYYTGKKDVDIQRKSDNSPVTAADIAANTHIVRALKTLTPDIPVIAEENETQARVGDTFWLVDPLDGTKSFISKSGEFTVNIGLIAGGIPVFGVIYVPAQHVSYSVGSDGKPYKRDAAGNTMAIAARAASAEGVAVVASKSHRTPETDAYISTLKVKSLVSAASSLKFCLVAEGKADIYPRFGRTMEWDTAAGHAIVRAAGGTVETLDGGALHYGKPDFANPYFVVKGK